MHTDQVNTLAQLFDFDTAWPVDQAFREREIQRLGESGTILSNDDRWRGYCEEEMWGETNPKHLFEYALRVHTAFGERAPNRNELERTFFETYVRAYHDVEKGDFDWQDALPRHILRGRVSGKAKLPR